METTQPSIRLARVHNTELDALRRYIEELYRLEEDYDSIVNIEEGVKSLLRNEALATAYFIHHDDAQMGYCILTKYHSVEKGGLTIFIDELYVRADYRRRGIGGEILSEIKMRAKEMGAKHLWVQTEPHNVEAQKFFESRGFKLNPYRSYEYPL